ncbi:hypothetical protein N7488_005602 [Penicillium malachiteum]|nr:hypothetical protein N7488_005602 [Penicillium malachiteum]
MKINTLVLLAIQALASTATTTVTCQDVSTQYLENPTFDDAATGWTVEYGTYGSSYDVYDSSNCPSGGTCNVLALNGDHLSSVIISQEVTGLSNGVTYSFSMWWQLFPIGTGSCTAYVSFDAISLGSQTLTSSSSAWTQFTGTYSSTDDSGDLEIMISCTSGSFSDDSEVNFGFFCCIIVSGKSSLIFCHYLAGLFRYCINRDSTLIQACYLFTSHQIYSHQIMFSHSSGE